MAKKVKRLKFVCPNCDGSRLSHIEDSGIIQSEIIDFSEDGNFSYDPPIITESESHSFQCCDCNFILVDKHNNNIVDVDKAAKWIKKNCPQK